MTFSRPSSPRRRGLCMIGRYAPAILPVRRSRTIFTESVSPNARIFAPHSHLHPQLNCCRNSLIALSSISDNFSCQHKTVRAPPCWPRFLQGRFEPGIFFNLCDCVDCADFCYCYPPQGIFTRSTRRVKDFWSTVCQSCCRISNLPSPNWYVSLVQDLSMLTHRVSMLSVLTATTLSLTI